MASIVTKIHGMTEVVLMLKFHEERQWAVYPHKSLTLIDRIMLTERGDPSGVDETSSRKQ